MMAGTYQGYQSQFNNRRNNPNSRNNPRMHPYAMFSSSGTAYGKGVGAGMQPFGKGKGGKGNRLICSICETPNHAAQFCAGMHGPYAKLGAPRREVLRPTVRTSTSFGTPSAAACSF